jgi:hypothetical protein
MNRDRFSSLVELQQAHDDLSRSQASTSRTASDPARVAEFIRRAVATGAVLDGREERSVAQSLTNFWAKRLKASTRAAAASDASQSSPADGTAPSTEVPPRPAPSGAAARPSLRPSPAPSDSVSAGDLPLSESALAGDSALAAEKLASRPADGDLIEDTLLAEYDSGTLRDSAAAADRVIETLSAEDAELARRLVLRLVRLRPEGKKFDAIPTSRAAMQTYGDPAAVDRIIDRLAATGVVRVTPGENPLADRIGLRSVDLREVWPRLNEWMDARVAFRTRASSPPSESGISRFADSVFTWLTKHLASISRFFVRLRRRVAPTPSTEISERELDDAETYHDPNARESEYLRRVRDRRRRLNEANRVLVVLATILLAFAALGWWRAQSQAKLATENADVAKSNESLAAAEKERAQKAADAAEAQRQIADDRLKLSSLRQVCRAWAEFINARGAEHLWSGRTA